MRTSCQRSQWLCGHRVYAVREYADTFPRIVSDYANNESTYSTNTPTWSPRNPQLCEMQTLQISFQNQKFSVIVIACSEGAKDDF